MQLQHSDWIKKQFIEKKFTKANYRNVLIHASFIETIVREKAGGAHFDCAIKTLQTNSSYQNGALNDIDTLRSLRNKITHDILKNKDFKTETDIKNAIKEMRKLLKQIYSRSNFIKEYFKKHFQIDVDIF